jgi:hypothetical protein
VSQQFHDWVLFDERPGKKLYSRFDPHTGDLEIMEEWYEEATLDQAAEAREGVGVLGSKDLRPLAVIPDSVKARALREGWYFDDAAWKRWANDPDNKRLRITGGVA